MFLDLVEVFVGVLRVGEQRPLHSRLDSHKQLINLRETPTLRIRNPPHNFLFELLLLLKLLRELTPRAPQDCLNRLDMVFDVLHDVLDAELGRN